MCGRYTNLLTYRQLVDLYRLTDPGQPTLPLAPRYNIAPTQDAPVVRIGKRGQREAAMLRWGLVPSWAKDADSAFRMINAKAETVAEKPAFRAAFRRRRCLVPADSFYEWKAVDGGKQPHRIMMADGAPFAMAGLWERWEKGDEPQETFCIITTEANELLRSIHNRMPVILDPADWPAWLEATETTIPLALLQPVAAPRMRAYPVSRRVNSPKNDDPQVILEVPSAAAVN
jgi:putative SOS response-associated peptidase YedK